MAIITASQNNYMNGDFAVPLGTSSGNFSAYMLGSGLQSSRPAFLMASLLAVAGQDCFINGYTSDSLDHKTALRFKSIEQQYVQINDSSVYDYLSSFTLNLYVRATASNGVNQGIVTKQNVLETWVNSVGNSFGMRANINGVWHTALTTSFVPGRWYMLSVVYNGSSIRFYMNGVEFYGENASGLLTDNNLPWYFGRYIAFGTYSDLDLAQVKLYNTALTAVEVAALYQPAYRKHCKHCYISQNPLTTIVAVKRCVVMSNPSTTNPVQLRSTLGLCISTDSVFKRQYCHIEAGGEATTTWDTRFTIDRNKYTSFDNIILIQGQSGRFNYIQNADVVYPITRESRKYIRLFTKQDPGVSTDAQECWMQTHHVIETSRACFINAVNRRTSPKLCYIPGTFTTLTGSHAAFVMNTEQHNAQAAYLQGTVLRSFNITKPSFVVSFNDAISDSQPLYMPSHVRVRLAKPSYIVTPGVSRGTKLIYLHSIVSSRRVATTAYMGCYAPSTISKAAYMYGHGSVTPSKGCFIVAAPTASSEVGAYINCPNINRPFHAAFVRGLATTTGHHSLYIKAEVNATGNKSLYMRGLASSFRVQRGYVVGPNMTAASSNKRCFISNHNPVTSLNAFIVSAPQSTKPAYIVSVGSTRRGKSVFIEA